MKLSTPNLTPSISLLLALGLALLAQSSPGAEPQLQAGTFKVDITDYQAGPVNDPSYAKALALKSGGKVITLITIDAVAIGEIGRIGNGYLPKVRAELQKEFQLEPQNILINASHCHSIVRGDVDQLTVQAVREALKRLVPVNVGAGRGREAEIMENRRLRLKDGSETDVRHAYSMPRDEDVAGVGPIDPEIGLLRLDRLDGTTLAAIYNFACHPIQGVPSGANTADLPGFASQVIEEGLGHGAMAFFVQGCAGDINPAFYKAVHLPRDAAALGRKLGLSVITGLRQIQTRPNSRLHLVHEKLKLPRGKDLEHRIDKLTEEQSRLVQSFQGTTLNFKTFLPLYIQHRISPEFPASYRNRYLHEQALGREDLAKFDASNRASLEAYLQNIHTMERLTRLQANLALLKRHQAESMAVGRAAIDAEITAVAIGDFELVTFPGELTVEIGLAIKRRARGPFTFVAGYTNGYLYYLPTEDQRNNTGYAQEDCDCIVAPEWRKLFDAEVDKLLAQLATPKTQNLP